MEIKKTSQARYGLWYQVAFSTEYRKKVFANEKIQEEVARLFREIALHSDLEVGEVQILFRPGAPNPDSATKDCSRPSCSDIEEREHADAVQEVEMAEKAILARRALVRRLLRAQHWNRAQQGSQREIPRGALPEEK